MALWLARIAMARPRTVALLLLALTLLGLAGALRLRSISYFEGTLAADDPDLLDYQRLSHEFGSDQTAILAFGCGATRACTDVFEPAVLALVRDVTSRIEAIEGVERVRSLSNVAVLVEEGGTLSAERLPEASDPDALRRFRALVERDPLLRGSLVADDLRASAIVVHFDERLADSARNQVVRRVLAEAAPRARAAGFELHSVGSAVFAAVTDGYVRSDLARLTPVMLVLLALLLAWIFRDGQSVALALGSVALPAIWAFGLMGWTGMPINPVTSTLPILILVVGVTDAVHLLVRVHELRASHAELRRVVEDVAREVGPPTTVTAVTSSLGFLAFLFGTMPNLRDYGVAAAAGILGAWLATFTLIPLALASSGRRAAAPRPAFELSDRLLNLLKTVALGRARLVLALAGVAVVIALVGLERVVPQNDTMKLLGEGDPLARAVRFTRERLRPGASVEVLLQVDQEGALLDPAVLRRMAEVEGFLRAQSGPHPVVSLLPILRVAERELGSGELALPERRDAASQLLLLAEAASPDDVRRVVTPDRRLARMSAAYAWGAADDVERDLARLREGVGERLDGAGQVSLTGVAFLSAHLGDVFLRSQITNFSSAFAMILLVLIGFTRSLPLSLLGMLPNVFPVAAILGFMGFAGVNLDIGTAMIASILLGISVDDTVYFLTHYQHARQRGADVDDAVSYTLAIAGKPAFFCAVVLALGFFVLGFSSFQSLAVFGVLSGVAVLLAALSEILLMPALLRVFAPGGRR